jgi:hypothetical protein
MRFKPDDSVKTDMEESNQLKQGLVDRVFDLLESNEKSVLLDSQIKAKLGLTSSTTDKHKYKKFH